MHGLELPVVRYEELGFDFRIGDDLMRVARTSFEEAILLVLLEDWESRIAAESSGLVLPYVV